MFYNLLDSRSVSSLFRSAFRLFIREWRSITSLSILLATRYNRLNRSDQIIKAIITVEQLSVLPVLVVIIIIVVEGDGDRRIRSSAILFFYDCALYQKGNNSLVQHSFFSFCRNEGKKILFVRISTIICD